MSVIVYDAAAIIGVIFAGLPFVSSTILKLVVHSPFVDPSFRESKADLSTFVRVALQLLVRRSQITLHHGRYYTLLPVIEPLHQQFVQQFVQQFAMRHEKPSEKFVFTDGDRVIPVKPLMQYCIKSDEESDQSAIRTGSPGSVTVRNLVQDIVAYLPGSKGTVTLSSMWLPYGFLLTHQKIKKEP